MPGRSSPIITGEVHHIFSKSIAGFKIFQYDNEHERMKKLLKFYKLEKPPLRFSAFLELKDKDYFQKKVFSACDNLVDIIAYCFMPTHFHLVLKQIKDDGISDFMSLILNSYAKYFNIKTKRKGPLWESRFKNIAIRTDEALLHVTRYVHLNPTTAYLVDRPQNWIFSSYREFLGQVEEAEKICNFSELMDVRPKDYREFVDSNIDYQRELAHIKAFFLDETVMDTPCTPEVQGVS